MRSINRALDILEALQDSGTGLTATEIAAKVGLSKSSAFELVQALLARDFIADNRSHGHRRYHLGTALVSLGDSAASGIEIGRLATPFLERLTAECGLTSRLGVLDDGFVVMISRVDGPGILRLSSALGRREYSHCSAIGKALLAALPVDRLLPLLERVGLPARTDKTIVDVDAFVADSRLTFQRGYAIDDEEDHQGLVCVGAAIYGRQEDPLAAISVTSIKADRPLPEDLHTLGGVLRNCADQIGRRAGGTTHEDWVQRHLA